MKRKQNVKKEVQNYKLARAFPHAHVVVQYGTRYSFNRERGDIMHVIKETYPTEMNQGCCSVVVQHQLFLIAQRGDLSGYDSASFLLVGDWFGM